MSSAELLELPVEPKEESRLLWWEARDQASAQNCVKFNLERRPCTDTGVGVTRGDVSLN